LEFAAWPTTQSPGTPSDPKTKHKNLRIIDSVVELEPRSVCPGFAVFYPQILARNQRENMKQILVYSDSLTWGIIPSTRRRLSFNDRWPGVLENKLNEGTHSVRVIENCLNGRRTVWEDPLKEGRNGLKGI